MEREQRTGGVERRAAGRRHEHFDRAYARRRSVNARADAGVVRCLQRQVAQTLIALRWMQRVDHRQVTARVAVQPELARLSYAKEYSLILFIY